MKIGKARDIRTKQITGRAKENPNYSKTGPDYRKYVSVPLEDDINDFLQSIGNCDVIDIKYQMSVNEDIWDSVLIIYEEE